MEKKNLIKRKAFTLVELMVAMAIIATLLSMAAVGISTLMRLSRDNQRRTTADNIHRLLEAYYADGNYIYPDELTVSSDDPPELTISGYTYDTIRLSGPTVPGTSVSSASTLSSSRFCYAKLTDGYVLAIELEGGDFFNVGNSATLCDGLAASTALWGFGTAP